jgi:hypothetical protein
MVNPVYKTLTLLVLVMLDGDLMIRLCWPNRLAQEVGPIVSSLCARNLTIITI